MEITAIVSVALKIPVTFCGCLDFLWYFKKVFLFTLLFFEEALMIFCGKRVEEPAIDETIPLNIII